MSAQEKRVPVVTYELLSTFERKLANRKAVELNRENARKEAERILEAKLANEKRLAEKRALREEINATHVIPSSVIDAKRDKKRAQKLALIRASEVHHDEERLASATARTEMERVARNKLLKSKIASEKIIPIGVKKLFQHFDEVEIGTIEYVECENLYGPVLATFARAIGFEVKKVVKVNITVLEVKKPYPMRLL